MRTGLIESLINGLRESFGSVRPPIQEEELRVLYDAKDYAGMILHIQKILCLNMNVRLGLVNSGGPDAPAWVWRPTDMPLYGTSAFRELTVIVYLRKTFLHNGNFEEAVLAIVHELCHILLDATGHSLREQEEAVDLTAMLFGFRDFYVTGCRSVRNRNGEPYEIRECSYLTQEEVGHAAIYMTFR